MEEGVVEDGFEETKVEAKVEEVEGAGDEEVSGLEVVEDGFEETKVDEADDAMFEGFEAKVDEESPLINRFRCVRLSTSDS